MVSERKKTIPKIDNARDLDNYITLGIFKTQFCCDEVVKTAYCPHCGTSKSKTVKYPQRFKICFQFHGGTEIVQVDLKETIKNLDISEEITLEYELTEENGDVNLISLSDGRDQFRLVKFGTIDVHGNYNNRIGNWR